jgi:hypothetical protein
MAVAVVIAMETLLAEDAEEVEEAVAVAAGEETIVSICRMSNALIVARKATIRLIVSSQKRTINVQTWFPKRILKKPVSNFNERNVHQKGQESKEQC